MTRKKIIESPLFKIEYSKNIVGLYMSCIVIPYYQNSCEKGDVSKLVNVFEN